MAQDVVEGYTRALNGPTGTCEYRDCDTHAETTIFYHTPPETVDYCAEHGQKMEDRTDATRII
jgi:hypothetical protein